MKEARWTQDRVLNCPVDLLDSTVEVDGKEHNVKVPFCNTWEDTVAVLKYFYPDTAVEEVLTAFANQIIESRVKTAARNSLKGPNINAEIERTADKLMRKLGISREEAFKRAQALWT